MANNTNDTYILPPTSAGISVFLSALNIFLSITASLGNTLILIALHKVSSIYPPTKLLFRCLAVTDLCVGLITQPLFATFHMPPYIHCPYACSLVYDISYALFFSVTVLTSTAISVDRLLAISLGLRYRHVVTLRRVRAVIVCFLLIGAFCWVSLQFISYYIALNIVLVLIMLPLVISMCCYMKIFLTLRQQQAQVQEHAQQGQLNGGGNSLNIARYKKTVFTVVWVQLALFVCCAPYCIVLPIWLMGHSAKIYITLQFTISLLYLNSSLNPILYCWRIRDVRQEVKKTIRKVCCSSS